MRYRQPILHCRSRASASTIIWLLVSMITAVAGGAFATSPNKETTMTTHPPRAAAPMIELRQYTLKPGQRDVLIDLFEREFVETQEAVGMHLVGQFRDLDRPDRFVWIRGFPDMASRAQSLQAFYGGPVWQAHRDAANATMIDSDNVLLLRPVSDGFRIRGASQRRVRRSAQPSARRRVSSRRSTTSMRPSSAAFKKFFDAEIAPELAAAGAHSDRTLRNRVGRKHFSAPAGSHGRARVRLVRAIHQRCGVA